MSDDDSPDTLIETARALHSNGDDEAAKAAYVALLARDPTHLLALNELGTIALSTGHRSAARTAYRQAILTHPSNPVAHVNLGNLEYEQGDHEAARLLYETALGLDESLSAAHQGLARTLTELGEIAAAQPHWVRGFAHQALVRRPYRGIGNPPRVLLLVSIYPGNIPTRQILDDRRVDVTALHVEFHDEAQGLPPHSVVFNAIGDADLCGTALRRATDLLKSTRAPVINQPAHVATTGRALNARRLATLPGVVAPHIRVLPRTTSPADLVEFGFPLLLRAPGFHTGRNFVRVESPSDLPAALASLPGDELLAIEYLDARGRDGMARKYRVMIIDCKLFPVHLAISNDWKVHYFSAAMTTSAAYRDEERRFLESMEEVLGQKAIQALRRIGRCMGLDYAGVDFAVRPDGALLLFEANATMAIVPPDSNPIWDYRRQAIQSVIDAARNLVGSTARPDTMDDLSKRIP